MAVLAMATRRSRSNRAGSTRTRFALRSVVVLGVLIAAFFCASLSGGTEVYAAPDPTHPELREFFPTGKYVLVLGGKQESGARILHSRKAGAFLILRSSYGRALLIQPKGKIVSAIDEDQVAARPDGGVDVVADAKIEKLGNFSLQGGDVAIRLADLRARLRPQPYLMGVKTAQDLILHTPEYERNGRTYQPSRKDIARLKDLSREMVVRVYFGTWCHTCSRLLPRILKVEKALEGSRVKFEYYGLPKGARAMAKDPLARRYGIKRIPTGVVTFGGRSAGQVNSTQLARPEAALVALIPSRN